MSGILLSIFTLILILVSIFLVLIILMQKASTSGGMGAALGGGIAESTFGTDTVNVLTKGTIYATIAFFIICLGLYLGYMASIDNMKDNELVLPNLQAENLSEDSVSIIDNQNAMLEIERTGNSQVIEGLDINNESLEPLHGKIDSSEGENP